MACLGATACSDPPQAASSSTPIASNSATPVDLPTLPDKPQPHTEQDPVEAALISVYFHAAYGPPTGEGEKIVVKLVDAAKALRDANDPWKRARAIERLYACAPDVVKALGPSRDEALAILEAPLDKLKAKFPKAGAADSKQVCDMVHREVNVAKSGCGASTPVSTSMVRPDNTMVVTTTLTVKRPLEELRAVVDPQNWDCCGKKYFSQACAPAYDAQGRLITSSDGKVPICKVATPGDPLPTPGSKWKGPLYERFRVGLLGHDVVFFNTVIDIDVTTAPGDPTYHMDFKLNRSLGGAIAWSKGSCDVDSGTVSLTPKDHGDVEVRATKELRLVFPTKLETELWTRITASTLTIAGDSLETSICCDPTQCKHP